MKQLWQRFLMWWQAQHYRRALKRRDRYHRHHRRSYGEWF